MLLSLGRQVLFSLEPSASFTKFTIFTRLASFTGYQLNIMNKICHKYQKIPPGPKTVGISEAEGRLFQFSFPHDVPARFYSQIVS